MAATAVTQTPQTAARLLTLPTEIRRQILEYAFVETCAPTSLARRYENSSDIQVYLASWSHKRRQYRSFPSVATQGIWGAVKMGHLFVINRQLMSDAIEVVYGGDFTFQFPSRFSVRDMDDWLGTIGDKKSLVKRIGISIRVNMERLTAPVAMYDQRGRKRDCQDWRKKFENLKRVEIRFLYISSQVRGGHREREILIEMILELMRVFRGLEVVVIDWSLVENGMTGIKEACAERRKIAGG